MAKKNTNPAAAKYQFTTEPPLPAKCVGCNFDHRGNIKFLDLTRDFDYYGAVLLCESCVNQIADLVDCGHGELETKIELLEAILAEKNEQIESLINSLAVFGGIVPGPPFDAAVDDEPDNEESEGSDTLFT